MDIPFVPGNFYHVFNRGNNSQPIFFKQENFRFFIRQWDKYLGDFIDIFAYCLLINHFHFLIRVKEETEILRITSLDKTASLNKTISTQFRRFFISYSMAINKQEERTGSLFQKNFKHKLIDNEKYLTAVIYYIHRNPIHHRLSTGFQDYEWSSYKKIIEDKASKLKKDKLLDWFGGKKHFIDFHDQVLSDDDLLKYSIE